ncbi:thymine dioxygenase [Panaeolus papilionaceus]|nr:thymine dioxygenase [Panaeolus papilionaceus]
MTTVETVNFAPFLNATDKKSVGEAILNSFKSSGFVYLLNHGIPQDKINGMFKWACILLLSKTLFDQPTEVKQLAPHPPSGAHHRGYSSPGREKVKQFRTDVVDINDAERIKQDLEGEVLRDLKESFEAGNEDNEGMPNIWYPDGVLPGFKEACLDFYWTLYETEKHILRAIAVGLGVDEEFFVRYHSGHDNQLRLLHYPSVPKELLKPQDSSRIPSHSDFCTLTILLQDSVSGLEVEDQHNRGTFIPVAPIPSTIVVNAGDFLMRWTNDVVLSTIHRVRAPVPSSDCIDNIPDRYSIPYFCAADLDTVIPAVPGTWDDKNPLKYEPISARNYVMQRLADNY